MWIIHCIINGICIVIPILVCMKIADHAIHYNAIGKYMLYCFGGILTGIGVTFFSVILNVKFKVMDD